MAAEQKQAVARAVTGLVAAGVGYWLGKEIADEPHELRAGREMVYWMGKEDSAPDLRVGEVDVVAGDPVKVTGMVGQAKFYQPRAGRALGLEHPAPAPFTHVTLHIGREQLSFFFEGDLRRCFKPGGIATVYTCCMLASDARGKPAERLDLGQRGGDQLLNASHLTPPLVCEPAVLAVGMGLAAAMAAGKRDGARRGSEIARGMEATPEEGRSAAPHRSRPPSA